MLFIYEVFNRKRLIYVGLLYLLSSTKHFIYIDTHFNLYAYLFKVRYLRTIAIQVVYLDFYEI